MALLAAPHRLNLVWLGPEPASDTPAIRVHCMPFGVSINPRLWPAIGLADVGADRECLQIVDCRVAVIALVGDDFLDHSHRIIGDRGHRVELLGGLGQRLLDRGRVAFVGILLIREILEQ